MRAVRWCRNVGVAAVLAGSAVGVVVPVVTTAPAGTGVTVTPGTMPSR